MEGEKLVRRVWMESGFIFGVTLEESFWDALEEIAKHYDDTVPNLVRLVCEEKPSSLAAALRVFVIEHYRVLRTPWLVTGQSVRIH